VGEAGDFMRVLAFAFLLLAGNAAPAFSEECPGNPGAIGTSRTITVDTAALPRIGSMQYRATLPLDDHEVVITFDDGPLPPYTDRILDTLAAHCVKVTYFLVGQMARAYPDTVRRIYNAGHVIGTHSQNHPFTFDQMGTAQVAREVNSGIASVQTAVGDPRAVAPFFRVPGLARSTTVESYLASQSLAVWSADEVADDWHRGITARDIAQRAIRRIEAKRHRGVLLLHDIHPATAQALPMLLKELKERGYRIVQAVPTGERPQSVPERPAPLVAENGGWPRVLKASAAAAEGPVKAVKSHHRKRLAANGRDPVVTASIAKKKRKALTAAAEPGWFPFGR
jgi:peptidoglycan/xylan/chitin deacetylase (PgdA/CDA1 family)